MNEHDLPFPLVVRWTPVNPEAKQKASPCKSCIFNARTKETVTESAPYIYIYIYIYRERERERGNNGASAWRLQVSLPLTLRPAVPDSPGFPGSPCEIHYSESGTSGDRSTQKPYEGGRRGGGQSYVLTLSPASPAGPRSP